MYLKFITVYCILFSSFSMFIYFITLGLMCFTFNILWLVAYALYLHHYFDYKLYHFFVFMFQLYHPEAYVSLTLSACNLCVFHSSFSGLCVSLSFSYLKTEGSPYHIKLKIKSLTLYCPNFFFVCL